MHFISELFESAFDVRYNLPGYSLRRRKNKQTTFVACGERFLSSSLRVLFILRSIQLNEEFNEDHFQLS